MEATSGNARWGWFAAWMLVGAGYAFALLTAIRLFVLPIPIIGTVLLSKHRSSLSAVPGLVSGLGLPLLLIAYLNREGPGNICTSTATMNRCDQEWSPWPWLLVGVVLMSGGCVAFVIRERRARAAAASAAIVHPTATRGPKSMEETMSPRARRIGAVLGVIVATWASVAAVETGLDPSATLWRVVVPLGAVLAWVAVWAWVKSRWTLAAAGFLLSLAVPAGYDNIFSPVIIVGLTTAAAVEAFHQKRDRVAARGGAPKLHDRRRSSS